MKADDKTHLIGDLIRLEPLGTHHVDDLVAAAADDAGLYRWSPVPGSRHEAAEYIGMALAWRKAGTALPFAIVRNDDGLVISSTRFWNLEKWNWPSAHMRHGLTAPDAGEIGYTRLNRSAVRTAANTEAKFLMLVHAFETWRVLRICLHTDTRNERSRAAIERIGGRFEGILRAHRLARDATPRDSARYSIVAEEWPLVREPLEGIQVAFGKGMR